MGYSFKSLVLKKIESYQFKCKKIKIINNNKETKTFYKGYNNEGFVKKDFSETYAGNFFYNKVKHNFNFRENLLLFSSKPWHWEVINVKKTNIFLFVVSFCFQDPDQQNIGSVIKWKLGFLLFSKTQNYQFSWCSGFHICLNIYHAEDLLFDPGQKHFIQISIRSIQFCINDKSCTSDGSTLCISQCFLLTSKVTAYERE